MRICHEAARTIQRQALLVCMSYYCIQYAVHGRDNMHHLIRLGNMTMNATEDEARFGFHGSRPKLLRLLRLH